MGRWQDRENLATSEAPPAIHGLGRGGGSGGGAGGLLLLEAEEIELDGSSSGHLSRLVRGRQIGNGNSSCLVDGRESDAESERITTLRDQALNAGWENGDGGRKL